MIKDYRDELARITLKMLNKPETVTDKEIAKLKQLNKWLVVNGITENEHFSDIVNNFSRGFRYGCNIYSSNSSID